MVNVMISNKIIKIAVCDDIIEERQKINKLLLEYADKNNHLIEVDEYISGEELIKSDLSNYNLIILDIFMDEINGIETARIIMDNRGKIPVIFCSTSNEFAQESYDVEALRYLTKPIDKEKFYQTLDKFFNYQLTLKMITFKQNRMDESIYLRDILWIEAGDHKSIIHTRNENITTSTIFKQFQEELKDEEFIKPIRYALVSLEAIASIPGDSIKLIDGTIVGVSRDMRKIVKKEYTEYKMKKLLKKGGVL